ncbi:hypothetical protein AB395_0000825 [Sinorhizobium fredii CCBAU 45436]|nr:hypothetical protein SF83666_c07920 [Sinorhizobium fredii CCBAU 83666]AWI56502.1 hypothetical protein AB395_0000825 [Sinorhizobium fredii CCBAU 45436]AWM24295.1 hypothetical protein AOX55_00001019 [Sinorhizobium fredii CCBAU 25509]
MHRAILAARNFFVLHKSAHHTGKPGIAPKPFAASGAWMYC